jgi:DNA-binding phage protein
MTMKIKCLWVDYTNYKPGSKSKPCGKVATHYVSDSQGAFRKPVPMCDAHARGYKSKKKLWVVVPIIGTVSHVPYDVADHLRTPEERATYLRAWIAEGDAALVAQARKDIARAKRRTRRRDSVIRFSRKDAHKVLTLLDNPPKPNKRLKGVVKTHKGMVGS